MNKARLFGLFGFLGLLGLFTDNPGLFGFFGFFAFFAIGAPSDERLAQNAYKAGFNGFVAALLGLSVLITAHLMLDNHSTIALITAAVFVVTIVTFVISMAIFERR
ncbi:MAG: DUF3796 domain-containing protein [Candidatus Woesearchaeota archaeon]